AKALDHVLTQTLQPRVGERDRRTYPWHALQGCQGSFHRVEEAVRQDMTDLVEIVGDTDDVSSRLLTPVDGHGLSRPSRFARRTRSATSSSFVLKPARSARVSAARRSGSGMEMLGIVGLLIG